jgi:hypothetical protein
MDQEAKSRVARVLLGVLGWALFFMAYTPIDFALLGYATWPNTDTAQLVHLSLAFVGFATVRICYEYWLIGYLGRSIAHITKVRAWLLEQVQRKDGKNGVWRSWRNYVLLNMLNYVLERHRKSSEPQKQASRNTYALLFGLGISPIPSSRTVGMVVCRGLENNRGFILLATMNAVRMLAQLALARGGGSLLKLLVL